jgi:hypothetical protein
VRCVARLRRLVALSVAIVCGGPLLGCSAKQCTLIGCAAPFEARFQVAAGQWPAGTYKVSVTADGIAASCDVTLPLGSCQTSSLECMGSPDWDVDYGGCALPPEQHAIYGVTFWRTTPTNVDIVLSRDGRQLAEGTFTPIYQSSQPNGPGCGDTCFGAPAATIPTQL